MKKDNFKNIFSRTVWLAGVVTVARIVIALLFPFADGNEPGTIAGFFEPIFAPANLVITLLVSLFIATIGECLAKGKS